MKNEEEKNNFVTFVAIVKDVMVAEFAENKLTEREMKKIAVTAVRQLKFEVKRYIRRTKYKGE